MSSKPKVSIKPYAYSMTGVRLDDMTSTKLLSEIRNEFPSAITAYVVIGFTDNKEIVTISHDRDHDTGKFNLERVDLEGSQPELVERMKNALVKVFG